MNGNMIPENGKTTLECVKSYDHTFRNKPHDFANQYL